MKTQDLVKTVADQTHLSEEQVNAVFRAAFDAISDGLAPGEEVTIAGFGSFRVSGSRDESLSPSRLAVADPARAAIWEEYFGPHLQADEVQRRLGLTDVQQVNRLAKQRRILAFRSGNTAAYPSFQFTERGELDPTISQVVMILSEVVETPYTIASWLKSPKESLEGDTPLRWLERGLNPDLVIEAAKLTAARLAS
jgi:hypothetical protein